MSSILSSGTLTSGWEESRLRSSFVTERVEIDVIATLNRRDFANVRPGHAPAFELIP